MLSTGMRAPMGLKVYGPDLATIEQAGLQFEKALKEVPSVKSTSVFYDRAVGAPYIEIILNREEMARYGMLISDVQEILQVAVGGMSLSSSIEGRERFPMRVRYARELRDNPEDIQRILVPAMNGVQIPLGEIADINYTRGAQMIRSENTFLVGYVIFDRHEGKAEVDAVEDAEKNTETEIRIRGSFFTSRRFIQIFRELRTSVYYRPLKDFRWQNSRRHLLKPAVVGHWLICIVYKLRLVLSRITYPY
jgi:Cu(I)/Ag(I) efflux system membrane protein CusA/SilA